MLGDCTGGEASELHAACLRMADIGVTGTDVSTIIGAAAWTWEPGPAGQAERLLELALNGLRTTTG